MTHYLEAVLMLLRYSQINLSVVCRWKILRKLLRVASILEALDRFISTTVNLTLLTTSSIRLHVIYPFVPPPFCHVLSSHPLPQFLFLIQFVKWTSLCKAESQHLLTKLPYILCSLMVYARLFLLNILHEGCPCLSLYIPKNRHRVLIDYGT